MRNTNCCSSVGFLTRLKYILFFIIIIPRTTSHNEPSRVHHKYPSSAHTTTSDFHLAVLVKFFSAVYKWCWNNTGTWQHMTHFGSKKHVVRVFRTHSVVIVFNSRTAASLTPRTQLFKHNDRSPEKHCLRIFRLWFVNKCRTWHGPDKLSENSLETS